VGRIVATKIIDLGIFLTGIFLAVIFDGVDRQARKRFGVRP
jgi:hypothetical protein